MLHTFVGAVPIHGSAYDLYTKSMAESAEKTKIKRGGQSCAAFGCTNRRRNSNIGHITSFNKEKRNFENYVEKVQLISSC